MANSKWKVSNYGYCLIAYGAYGGGVYYLLDASDWNGLVL